LKPMAINLKNYIKQHRVKAEIISPGVPTPTVTSAARALSVSEDQIIKSLLFQGKGGGFVLAIAAGNAKINTNKLAEVAGIRKPKLARPEVVKEVLGYPVGGAPPIGHRRPVKVVVDRAVLEQEVVYGGGGREDLLLRITPTEIIRLTKAQVADITG